MAVTQVSCTTQGCDELEDGLATGLAFDAFENIGLADLSIFITPIMVFGHSYLPVPEQCVESPNTAKLFR
jgi:hypothetical protein